MNSTINGKNYSAQTVFAEKLTSIPSLREVMIKVGRAIVRSLPDGKDKKRIIIGKDTRISGDMIECHCRR
ncbi:MAG: hypothetical protein R2874_04025 [Desulfobacterales bacterium]